MNSTQMLLKVAETSPKRRNHCVWDVEAAVQKTYNIVKAQQQSLAVTTFRRV